MVQEVEVFEFMQTVPVDGGAVTKTLLKSLISPPPLSTTRRIKS